MLESLVSCSSYKSTTHNNGYEPDYLVAMLKAEMVQAGINDELQANITVGLLGKID